MDGRITNIFLQVLCVLGNIKDKKNEKKEFFRLVNPFEFYINGLEMFAEKIAQKLGAVWKEFFILL